jgi:hypothetical protein
MSAEWSDVYEQDERERKLRETAGSLCWSDAHRDFASCYVCQKAYAALAAAHASGWRAGAEATLRAAIATALDSIAARDGLGEPTEKVMRWVQADMEALPLPALSPPDPTGKEGA